MKASPQSPQSCSPEEFSLPSPSSNQPSVPVANGTQDRPVPTASSPIKILFVINGLGTGGAENMLLKLLARLDKKSFAPTVFALQLSGALLAEFEGLGIPILGSRGGPVRMFCDLYREASQLRPDLIQGWMYHGNLAAQLVSRLLSHHPPVVTHITHNPTDTRQLKLSTRMVLRGGAWLSSCANRIVYPSQAARLSHERLGYMPRRSIVIPNGFDIESFKPEGARRLALREQIGVAPEDILLGCVGRFHPHKGHHNLLAALRHTFAEFPRSKCLFVGAGLEASNPALRDYLADPLLQHRIILLGRRKDIPDLMNALDVFVNPSATESFPLVLGEAMLSALPAVVTDVGDCALVLGDGGYVVPPGDPLALGNAMSRLLRLTPEERHEIGNRGRHRIVANFSLESVVSQYEDLYLHILGRP